MTVSTAGRDPLQGVCMQPGRRPWRQRWWESPPFRVRLHLVFFIALFFFFFHFWLCCMVSGVLVLWPEINLQGSPHCPILKVASDGNLNQIEVNMKGNSLPYVMKRPQVWVWWDLGSWAISSGVFVFHHQWVLLCVGFIVQQILPNGNKTAMNISTFPTRQLKLWERGDTCCQQWPQCPETDSYWAILEQMFAHDQSLGPEVWNIMCSPQPRI